MIKKILFLIFTIIISQSLAARGAADSEREYRTVLDNSFKQIIFAVESGDITSRDGKIQLSIVREKFRRPYNDEFGILESLIDQVGEHYLTAVEAHFHFSLLQNKKLMEYRREKKSIQTESSGFINDGNNHQSGRDDESGKGGESNNQGEEQRKGNS